MKNANAALARTFLRDRAAIGDHGFTGESLKAWHRQRALLRQALREIVAKGWVGRRLAAAVVQAHCPRFASLSYQRGTDAGYWWTWSVNCLVDTCTRKSRSK